jgi:protease-4
MVHAISSAAALHTRFGGARDIRRPILVRGLLVGLTALLAVLAGCGPTSYLITPVPAERRLEEHVVLREAPLATRKIALIDVEGVLKDSRGSSLLGVPEENPVALFKEKLDHAARDSHVKAVVLRINSPGGTVTASDLMYRELCRFKECTGKPVVTSMLDLTASGGYYLACASDKIYALPTTVTGSIGVIMLLPEVAGTMEKLGMSMRVFKSGEMKDAGSLFRDMTPRDREMFQGLITEMYARFFAVVHEGRPGIPEDHLREIADGRVFLGPEAQKEGLVDEVGGVYEALGAAKAAAGLCDQNVIVVEYARPLGYRANIYARSDPPAPQVNMINIQLPEWLSSPSPQMMYLWAPAW